MHKAILAAAVLAVFGQVRASGETYTMETYYPAPVGVYTTVTVTSGTVLARDGGNVGIGTASPADKLHVNGNATVTGNTVLARDGGTVSVGASNLAAQLNVNGQAAITGKVKADGVVIPGSFASDPADAASKVEGAIYYNTTTKTHRVYRNAAWAELGGGSAEVYSADQTQCTASLDGKQGFTISAGAATQTQAFIQMYNSSSGEEFQGSLKARTCRKGTGPRGSVWAWQ